MNFGSLDSIDTQRPPSPRTGSTTAEQIYQAVGAALTQWETLEENLALVFCAYHGWNIGGLERAYGYVQGTSTRIKMLKAAAEARFVNDIVSRAEHIRAINAVEKLCTLRNDIAHGKVTQLVVNGDCRGFFLLPPSHSSQKNFAGWDYPKKLEQLEKSHNREEVDQFVKFLKSKYQYSYCGDQVLDIAERFAMLSKLYGEVWASILLGHASEDD